MRRLAVIGAGAMGQLIAHYATAPGQFLLAGFLDDHHPTGSRVGLGEVLGGTREIERRYADSRFDEILVAVGYKHFGFRKQIFESLKGRVPFARLVHPATYMDPSCQIGEGVVVLPGCTLDRGISLEDNVFLNVGCVVAHDTTLGAHSFLGPGVTIAGCSRIGQCCFLGTGSTIVNRINVCNDAQTGAGSVVTRDIIEPGVYVGVPARRLNKESATE